MTHGEHPRPGRTASPVRKFILIGILKLALIGGAVALAVYYYM